MEPDTRTRNYGCLTPLMREHLKTRNVELTYDNEEELGKARGKRKQNDFHIKLHAKQALKDLVLVSESYSEKQNLEIFSMEELVELLRAIVLKIGREKTPKGAYYLMLIDSIIDTLNRDELGYERLDYNIKVSPISFSPDNIPDKTNIRAERSTARYSQFKKK
jgi:hypothetical protein